MTIQEPSQLPRPLPAAQPCYIAMRHGFVAASWFWPIDAPAVRTAVLIVPGIAHEERTMSGGVTALAEQLAVAGVAALAIDLHATANSSGSLTDVDIGEQWRRGIHAALAHVRAAGFHRIVVAGVRLGALLALDALHGESLAAIVAWAPVTSGRRHMRELRMLQGAARANPARDSDADGAGISVGAFDLPPNVVRLLCELDASRCAAPRCGRLLLLEDAPDSSESWRSALATQDVAHDVVEARQTYAWLFSASDQPALPLADIEAITRWCSALDAQASETACAVTTLPVLQKTVTFSHLGHRIQETIVEIAPHGLHAILSEPAGRRTPGATRLLLSSVGPGRTFTDLARDEASHGHAALRFDFAGFGASRKRPRTLGGELYTEAGRDDVQAAVHHLHRTGHKHIVPIGFCAGAWSMLQAGPMPGIEAVVALNVALYWQPDSKPTASGNFGPADAMQWLSNRQRAPLLQRLAARLVRLSRARSEPVTWVERLCESGVEVMLAYAEADPGFTYLHTQLHGGLRHHLQRGRLAVTAYPGLGHLAEGKLARGRMIDDVQAFVGRSDRRLANAQIGAGAARDHAAGYQPQWLASSHGLSRY